MQTIIHFLVFSGLLVSGATPQPGDELIQAVENGDRSSVSRLLEAGVDVNHVNNNGISALMMTAARGRTELVPLLLASGAEVNQLTGFVFGDYRTPLTEAIRNEQTDMVKILLLHGADVNIMPPRWFSPLQRAVMILDQNGDSEIVSVLIENNANVNLLSSAGGHSALSSAARWHNAPIVAKLIRAGADVNLVEFEGVTALMLAAQTRVNRHQMRTISLLINAGANINEVSTHGYTALLKACMQEHEDPVRVLIAYGANVNQRTALGTPLMKALENGNSNNVRLLVLAGAETSNLPENLFQELIHPIMSSLQELVTQHSSLITTAFVELKNTEQKENMFKNAAFRDSFHEWDDLRIDRVSRIISNLVTLETGELFVTYILAPFLVTADTDRLNRFGLVLQFLTVPCENKTNVIHGTDKPELVRLLKATFRYAIVMGSLRDSFDPTVDAMYAVYSNLNAEMRAVNQAMGVISDVNIGTVLQFVHGEFGIYSKYSENLKQMLI